MQLLTRRSRDLRACFTARLAAGSRYLHHRHPNGKLQGGQPRSAELPPARTTKGNCYTFSNLCIRESIPESGFWEGPARCQALCNQRDILPVAPAYMNLPGPRASTILIKIYITSLLQVYFDVVIEDARRGMIIS